MTTLQAAGTFNVEASLNAWLRTQLAAITGLPSWLATLPVPVTYLPEATASLPALTVVHLPGSLDDAWQGRTVSTSSSTKGRDARAIMEVDAWVTRANANWLAQLRTMQDCVMTVLTGTTSVVIKDYATSQTSPADTAYLVRLRDARLVTTAPDPNPDIERRRMLVDYDWVFRA